MSEHGWKFLCHEADVAVAVRRSEFEDAASLPLLPESDCAALMAEGRGLAFRPAQAVVGQEEAAVYQDFDLAVEFPADSGFRALARALESLLGEALGAMDPPPLADPFRINDLVLQRYPAGCRGITPHRDHIRYTGLVAIVVLAGQGRFWICGDRTGTDAREIWGPPGHLLLMRAPGLFGRRDRPFHMLSDVTAERWSLGLRHDERAAP